MELSRDQIVIFKDAFFRYDFSTDYSTTDSTLLTLREELDSINFDKPSKEEVEELKVHSFKWIDDSTTGLFFVYHKIPLDLLHLIGQ
ncbi:hypothetical protein LVD15_10335 [Fulvivirga maritima]|uniref:hypothetical protein n=1 Tax=Fulvivirga maritima TaxID=2904247 RepID=UPI001F2CF5D3|nr:hypothetical protein [Fulvivirga maritima]UII28796.1 hypothetical protein LVD15_10335 [Fulvivirga maritima]